MKTGSTRDEIQMYCIGESCPDTNGFTPEFVNKVKQVREIFKQAAKEAGVGPDEFIFEVKYEFDNLDLNIFKKGQVKHYHVRIAEGVYSATLQRWTEDVIFHDDDTLRAQARAVSRLMRGEEWKLEDSVEYSIYECYDWWCLPPGVMD